MRLLCLFVSVGWKEETGRMDKIHHDSFTVCVIMIAKVRPLLASKNCVLFFFFLEQTLTLSRFFLKLYSVGSMNDINRKKYNNSLVRQILLLFM